MSSLTNPQFDAFLSWCFNHRINVFALGYEGSELCVENWKLLTGGV